ncbi:hypothetical protein [Streptomyces sp. ODS28]|uniref:hypothetical protein n=1 Tax=Streptomyces sp. ODS28 TaxID=3136688 RepID=UPI0031EB54C8
MAESVPVRCPVCRREHSYTPPVYPCACGAPVTLPVRDGAEPVLVEHRTWAGSWVRVRCGCCGAEADWPHPELGCGCGACLHLPVDHERLTAGTGGEPAGPESPAFLDGTLEGGPSGAPAQRIERGADARPERPKPPEPARKKPPVRPAPPRPRPAFQPVTIRTAQDARTAAAQYLRWLGYADVRMTEKRPASGVDVRGTGVVGHVDPTTSLTALRAIETLWLNGLNETAVAVCFSLAGYAREARTRADELSVPLFVLDLTGTPQPVNDAADDLLRT